MSSNSVEPSLCVTSTGPSRAPQCAQRQLQHLRRLKRSCSESSSLSFKRTFQSAASVRRKRKTVAGGPCVTEAARLLLFRTVGSIKYNSLVTAEQPMNINGAS